MKVKIANKSIGDDEPIFIIAEAGINHNGSLETAKKLIDIAAEAGADCVKFQKRNIKAIYQKELLDDPTKGEQSFQYALPILKNVELTEKDYREILGYCKEKNIIFGCSPWDNDSVDFLEKLGILFYKIASPDLTNMGLLEYVASKNKPIILSTGMSKMDEIKTSVNFLKRLNAELVLLHCNSTYPAPPTEVNLRFMETLRREFDVPVGYSGHERGIIISIAAAAMGAHVIERHLTLDRSMKGPDHKASLEPAEFKQMVDNIRLVEDAKGSYKKRSTRGEIINRDLLGKSLLAARHIKKGDVLNNADIIIKGPGKGISPQRISELIGKTAKRDIKQEDFFIESDISDIDIEIPEDSKIRWGLKVRFNDIDNLMVYKPKLVEFHFSDKDLEFPIPNKKYDTELAVHAPEYYGHYLLDFCSKDKKLREVSIDTLQKTIDKTNELKKYYKTKMPFIIFHTGGMSLKPLKGKDPKLMENFVKSLEKIDAKGVELLPENQVPLGWFFGGQWYLNTFIAPEEIRWFCETYKYNICFDIAHAQLYCNVFKKNIIDFIKLIRPFVRELHLADAYGVNGEGVQIGEGEIDFKEAMKYFKDYRYGVIPEIWRGHLQNGREYLIAMQKLAPLLK